jgi:hypothetical protein
VTNLKQQIAAAFPMTKLSASSYADPHGMWRTYPDCDAFEAGTDGRTWADLDGAFVEEHFMALPWMKPAAFASLLPAYLTALVDGKSQNELPDLLLRQLTRREGREAEFDARIAKLDANQRAAVTSVLTDLPATERWSHYRSEFDAARTSWTKFAQPSGQ